MPAFERSPTRVAGEFQSTARFEVTRCLGAGGMGIVYEAVDRRRGTTVALKTLRTLDAEALLRFKREFRALACIHHPNLVSLYELAEEHGEWFFTMEFVPGTNFLAWVGAEELALAQTATLSANRMHSSTRHAVPVSAVALGYAAPDDARLRDAIAQLARGLMALHRAGKIHQDVKPSNTWVSTSGRVVLLDFGLVEDRAGPRSPLAGTLPYMAPERFARAAAGPPSDWFAVGVMLYEALTGRRPFDGTLSEIMAQHRAGQVPRPNELVRGVPDDLARLCIDLLHSDPAKRPSGADILERVSPRKGPRTPRISPRAEDPSEIASILAAFDDVRSGSTVSLLIRGEARSGKSALLSRFCERVATIPDVVLLRSRCDERELLPFRAIDSLVDALVARTRSSSSILSPPDATALRLVFPVVAQLISPAAVQGPWPIEGRELRRRAFAQLRAWLAHVGEGHTLVLAVEDLHASDADGTALLTYLLAPPDAPRLLLVATEQVTSAARSAALERPWGDVREVRLARGNLEESPAAEESLLRKRLTSIEPDALHQLEALAVAVRPIEREVVARATAQSTPRTAAMSEVLLKAHLVRASTRQGAELLEIADPRLRTIVESDLVERRALSERLAGAMDSANIDDEVRALQWRDAGNAARAAAAAAAAAQAADSALAFERATRLWRMALDLSEGDTEERHALRLGYAAALANAGRQVDAAGEYLAATGGRGAEEALDLRRRAAELYLNAGHIDEGMNTLRAVLDSAGMTLPKTPARAAAGLLARRALLWPGQLSFTERRETEIPARDLLRVDVCRSVAMGLGFVDNIRAAYFQTVHMGLALRAGETKRLALALSMDAPFVAAMGRWGATRSRALWRTADALAQRAGDPMVRALTCFSAGFSLLQQGQWRSALEPIDAASTLFAERCAGVSFELMTSQMAGLWALFYLGNLAELERRTVALVHDADHLGNLYAAANLRLGLSNVAWLQRDDVEGSRRVVDDALSLWSQPSFDAQHCFALIARVHSDLYAGQADAAHARMRSDWPPLERSFLLHNQLIRGVMLHLRAGSALAAAGADPSRADLVRQAERDARRLLGEGAPWLEALGEGLLGGVAEARGNTAKAGDRYAAATTAFERADMPLYAAASSARHGRVLGGARGERLVASARERVAAQGATRPDRVLAMLAPGTAL